MLTTPHCKKLIMLRNIARSLGIRMILRYGLSNGKGMNRGEERRGAYRTLVGKREGVRGVNWRIILKCTCEKRGGGMD
jgi:hypothetical protein